MSLRLWLEEVSLSRKQRQYEERLGRPVELAVLERREISTTHDYYIAEPLGVRRPCRNYRAIAYPERPAIEYRSHGHCEDVWREARSCHICANYETARRAICYKPAVYYETAAPRYQVAWR